MNFKPIFTVVLFVFLSYPSLCQDDDCYKSHLVEMQIRQSLQSDIYYFLDDIEKESIRNADLFYSKEIIPLNLKRFDVESIEEHNDDGIALCDDIGYSKKYSNYIAFTSGLLGNYVMVEVFFKREEYLNRPSDSEYETWRRLNAGVSYLFQFNDSGCLVDVKKTAFFYD